MDENAREDEEETVVCYSYTAARRYPLVIGKIGGFVLPSPLSPAQVMVLLGGFFGLLATRSLWGVLLPGGFNLIVLLGGPCGLAWAVRHLRMEGRSPIRMLLGQISYLLAPRHGWARGRPRWSAPRPDRIVQRILFVEAPANPLPALVGHEAPEHHHRVEAAAHPTPAPTGRAAVIEFGPPRWKCLERGA